MKGIILAAGRGSRMQAHTDHSPKCLVELAGKPLLHWQLAALRKAGVTDIAVVCGYKAELLRSIGNAAEGGFTTLLNADWASSNMLSSLLCAREWSQGQECVISYSDIVYPAAHVRALMPNPQPVALSYDTLWAELWSQRFGDPLDDAETFREKDGLLLEIGAKPRSMADIHGQYMGLLKLNAHGWNILHEHCVLLGEAVARTDMTAFLRRLLDAGVHIGAVPVTGQWCEVDNGDDLALYQRKTAQGNSWSHDWRTL